VSFHLYIILCKQQHALVYDSVVPKCCSFTNIYVYAVCMLTQINKSRRVDSTCNTTRLHYTVDLSCKVFCYKMYRISIYFF